MLWGDGWVWGLGGSLMTLVVVVLFWGGIIALVVWAIRQFRPGGPAPSGGDSALRILEERYARGEIDEEEFRRRREILRGEAPR